MSYRAFPAVIRLKEVNYVADSGGAMDVLQCLTHVIGPWALGLKCDQFRNLSRIPGSRAVGSRTSLLSRGAQTSFESLLVDVVMRGVAHLTRAIPGKIRPNQMDRVRQCAMLICSLFVLGLPYHCIKLYLVVASIGRPLGA